VTTRLTRAETDAVITALNQVLAGEVVDGYTESESEQVTALMLSALAKLMTRQGTR